MPPSPSLPSRIRGSLYGLAVVDALGGPVEFRFRGTFPLVTTYRYNAHFDLPPGSWTDDTSMTLCLAQSLVTQKGKFDVSDQVRNYVRWYKQGYMSSSGRCFDIGNATRIALGVWEKDLISAEEHKGIVKASTQEKIDEQLGGETNCGNGSLMRTVPVALAYFRERESVIAEYTAMAGRVTHPHATCVEACQVYVMLICEMLRKAGGEQQVEKEALFALLKGWEFESPVLRDTFGKYGTMEDLKSAKEGKISSSGFVVHTLEAALWCFFTTENFKEGALKAVNLGDDADTIGAVYGGFAGAYYGIEEVPAEWMEGLQARGMVEGVVEGLAKLMCEKEGREHMLPNLANG